MDYDLNSDNNNFNYIYFAPINKNKPNTQKLKLYVVAFEDDKIKAIKSIDIEYNGETEPISNVDVSELGIRIILNNLDENTAKLSIEKIVANKTSTNNRNINEDQDMNSIIKLDVPDILRTDPEIRYKNNKWQICKTYFSCNDNDFEDITTDNYILSSLDDRIVKLLENFWNYKKIEGLEKLYEKLYLLKKIIVIQSNKNIDVMVDGSDTLIGKERLIDISSRSQFPGRGKFLEIAK